MRFVPRDASHTQRRGHPGPRRGGTQALSDPIAGPPSGTSHCCQRALVRPLIGSVVLHPHDKAPWQRLPLRKQVLLDIAAITNVNPTGGDYLAGLLPLRTSARRDRHPHRNLAQRCKCHGPLRRPMRLILPHGPAHPRQGWQSTALDRPQVP